MGAAPVDYCLPQGEYMNRLSHTTAPTLRETMTPEAYAANHARRLDLQAEPIALQRWAVEAKRVIEQLLKLKGV